MKASLFILYLFTLTALTLGEDNCADSSELCSEQTEYNAYLDCLKENKRQKRDAGCFHSDQSCEYVDCTDCHGCAQQNECSSGCRKCCMESCSTQLCCHKTCNNQCKTNYCRIQCRKECKQHITNIENGDHSGISSNTDTKTQNKHNITTIINLHNFINNTNQIDIPIKINNTNYNNITLLQDDQSSYSGSSTDMWGGRYKTETDENGNKCCQVIGPRICNRIQQFPYTRCFHYRKHRCGTFCNAPIVHAQPQQVCEENQCHNRMIYIPQPQPKCFHVPYWPFVNCGGGGQMHNCHGCYKHYTVKSHIPHGGCSRCYDDGFGSGPYFRQGPFYRPGFAHTPSCMQIGGCGYGMGMGMGGYGYGMEMGYGGMMGSPMMGAPMMGTAMMGGPMMGGPMMGGPMMGAPMMGGPMMGAMLPPGDFPGYSGALGGYPINNLGYPSNTYMYNIPYGEYNSNITVSPENKEDNNLIAGIQPSIDVSVQPASRSSRYAAIVIEGPKTHNEKKDAAKETKGKEDKKKEPEKKIKTVKKEATKEGNLNATTEKTKTL